MVISPNKWELDTQAYLNICNITSTTPRQQLRDFAAGVNDLGLWNSMVCWPLRSSQNYGSGTTAYSLGGLGTFNGTLVNGPTWGVDGINFDGTDDRVDLPNESFGTGNAATSVWSFSKNDTTSVRATVTHSGDGNSAGRTLNIEAPGPDLTNDSSVVSFNRQTTITKSTAWKSLFVGNTVDGFAAANGGNVSQFSLNNALNKNGAFNAIGASNNGGAIAFHFDGLIAAVIRINATPTTTLNGQIHNLYKTTLGTGLGLP
jgi:hypothetical protein